MSRIWKFTQEVKEVGNITLRRIQLTVDCKYGSRGTLGGWIESEKNLGDNAWVFGNAQVYGNARVNGGLLLRSGECFASKESSWDVIEVENGDTVLLIRKTVSSQRGEKDKCDRKVVEIDGRKYELRLLED